MSLKKDSLVLFFSKLVSSFIGLLSIAFLSRFLSVKEYGLYRQWIVVTTFLVGILTLGFPAAINYFLPRSHSEKEEVSWLTNILTAILVICMIAMLFTPIIGRSASILFKNDMFINYQFLLTLSVSLSVVVQIFPNLFVVKRNRKAIALFSIIPNLLWFSILILLAVLKTSLEIYIFVLLIKPIIALIIGLIKSGKLFVIKYFERKKIEEVFRFSLPMGLSALIGSLMLYTDKFVVGSMMSAEDFAVFVNGAYEIPFISLITASLFTVITPKLSKAFSEGYADQIRKSWVRAGETLIPIMISITTTLVFFAKTFVSILYSEKYLAAVPVFMIYQSMGVIRIYSYSSLFVASGKTRLYLFNTLLSATLNLALDFFLVQVIGYIGAALATVLSTFFLMILQIVQTKHITESKTISSIFPIRSFTISILTSSLITFSFSLLLTIGRINIFIQLVIAIIAFMLSFIILSKIVSEEILDIILKILKNIKSLPFQ